MRTAFAAALLLALPTLAPAALAGDTGACSFGDCRNECPLAKQANERRSTGTESVLASKAVQKGEIARVLGNLARI